VEPPLAYPRAKTPFPLPAFFRSHDGVPEGIGSALGRSARVNQAKAGIPFIERAFSPGAIFQDDFSAGNCSEPPEKLSP
jgi:hypothetical protein